MIAYNLYMNMLFAHHFLIYSLVTAIMFRPPRVSIMRQF